MGQGLPLSSGFPTTARRTSPFRPSKPQGKAAPGDTGEMQSRILQKVCPLSVRAGLSPTPSAGKLGDLSLLAGEPRSILEGLTSISAHFQGTSWHRRLPPPLPSGSGGPAVRALPGGHCPGTRAPPLPTLTVHVPLLAHLLPDPKRKKAKVKGARKCKPGAPSTSNLPKISEADGRTPGAGLSACGSLRDLN